MEKSSPGPRSLHDLESLRVRHRELEARLAELERHLALGAAEQVERSRLKKEKLWIKDRVAFLTQAATAPMSATAAAE